MAELGLLSIMRYLLFLCVLFVSSCGKTSSPDRITVDREARLQPVIQYMETFVQDHHRLPTRDEFQVGTAGMNSNLILKDRTDPYAARKGAKADTDYMVGIWRADWYHFYKSWDKSFLNGADEYR